MTPNAVRDGSSAFAPVDAENELWDAIVIGTGMGGATAGHALAARGWRVLFVEKGRFLHDQPQRAEPAALPDDGPAERLALGWWPYQVAGHTSFGEERFFAPLGCGSGGTTSLYAAQLERLRPEDFRPRANHPNATDSTLPDSWPIEHAELTPYYEHAEKLYRVSGTSDPLAPASDAVALRNPPPASERDRALFESFETAGLHPYRAHVGYEFVEGCTGCGGVRCPRECKSDSGRICLAPALRDHGAKLLDDCEVVELDADASSVRTVVCRQGARELRLRGRVVVLAAGAFVSPVLLLQSRSQFWPSGLANKSGQVGRNLMVHAHVWVAVGSNARLASVGPVKSISLNDFYVDRQAKLGTFQSLGITVTDATIAFYLRSRMGKLPKALQRLTRPFIRVLAHVLAVPFRNAAVFAGIIEDLPYADNCVVPDPATENGWRFEYRYPEELRLRSRMFFRRLRDVLGKRHRLLMISPRKNNLDFGHVCGTIRFGSDPATSVLNRDNRAHDVTNLYVVDASFFPSSGGTNLSLTIAANALRVSAKIDQQLAERNDVAVRARVS